MKTINDTSYKKLFTLKKYKDLYDFSSLECRMALLIMLILDLLFAICSNNIGSDATVNECIKILDNIGIALIGFLGFIVTGLAILTGAISSKIIKRLQDRNKMVALEKILLSFYLIGLVSAFLTVAIFILHFISILQFQSNYIINIIIFSILSYFIIFTIFYAVKLIGNCLELFLIINSMQIVDDTKAGFTDYKAIYNNYRITALEKIRLSTTSLKIIREYEKEIKKLIECDNLSDNDKKILLSMHGKHFSNNE